MRGAADVASAILILAGGLLLSVSCQRSGRADSCSREISASSGVAAGALPDSAQPVALGARALACVDPGEVKVAKFSRDPAGYLIEFGPNAVVAGGGGLVSVHLGGPVVIQALHQ